MNAKDVRVGDTVLVSGFGGSPVPGIVTHIKFSGPDLHVALTAFPIGGAPIPLTHVQHQSLSGDASACSWGVRR